MEQSTQLYDTLKSFKGPNHLGQSSQQQLLDYCTTVLGSIEHFHVDFKTKTDPAQSSLSEPDKKNLAKAISGFANSGGGVLIWGIEDKTLLPKPIINVHQFMSLLLNLAAQTTDPVAPGIDADWLPADSGSGSDGFGLLYVPESQLPPHRVILKYQGIQNHYFIRTAESFVIASHSQLEDMFGRRPQPKLRLATRIVTAPPQYHERQVLVTFGVFLGIENTGRGAARSPFLAIALDKPYEIDQYGIDGNKHFGLPLLVPAYDSQESKYGASSEFVIYPSMTHEVTRVGAHMDIPFDELKIPDLVIRYTVAAEGMQPLTGVEKIEGTNLRKAILGK